MDQNTPDFRQLLDNHHGFPCDYKFKFVVPAKQKRDLVNIFENSNITERLSSTGKYVSLTITRHVESAEAVLKQYEECSKIDNIVML